MSKRPLVERLMDAMDECARARGEAMWTNGYRARYDATGPGGRHASPTWDADESTRLYAKERDQWQHVSKTEARFRRTAQRTLRRPSGGSGR